MTKDARLDVISGTDASSVRIPTNLASTVATSAVRGCTSTNTITLRHRGRTNRNGMVVRVLTVDI